jgi:hypothetical protein
MASEPETTVAANSGSAHGVDCHAISFTLRTACRSGRFAHSEGRESVQSDRTPSRGRSGTLSQLS